MAKGVGDESRGFTELNFILAMVGHCLRNAVGCEQKQRGGAALCGELLERFASALDHRLDESRVIEKRPEFFDLWRAIADGCLCGGDILQVLPAAGIAAEGGREQGDSPPDAVVFHLS